MDDKVKEIEEIFQDSFTEGLFLLKHPDMGGKNYGLGMIKLENAYRKLPTILSHIRELEEKLKDERVWFDRKVELNVKLIKELEKKEAHIKELEERQKWIDEVGRPIHPDDERPGCEEKEWKEWIDKRPRSPVLEE